MNAIFTCPTLYLDNWNWKKIFKSYWKDICIFSMFMSHLWNIEKIGIFYRCIFSLLSHVFYFMYPKRLMFLQRTNVFSIAFWALMMQTMQIYLHARSSHIQFYKHSEVSTQRLYILIYIGMQYMLRKTCHHQLNATHTAKKWLGVVHGAASF